MRSLRSVVRLAPVVALVIACGSKSSPVGEGGECQLATDCQEGLVCVPQANGSRVCSKDLTGVQQLPPSQDAGKPPAADAGGASDGAAPGDSAAPVDVAAPTDTGAG